MLEELTIRNYALIDSIAMSFLDGFNVLTGETGAGKSIIVGSLGFLMGGKAEADVIRTGCEEAGVCAVVSIGENNVEALEWLSSRDIETDDGTVIIRRNIKSGGRGSAFVQNTPVTKADLSGFMSLLFDMHGQHDHGSLLNRESHRRYLDRFAGIEDEVIAYNKLFIELAEKRRALEVSVNSLKDREARLEILRYAVDEITTAAVRRGELAALENEAQMLSGFEKLANNVNTAADSFFDGEESALSLVRRTRSAIDGAAAVDSGLAGLQKRLEDLYYEAQDIAGEFRSYRDSLSYDPRRQQQVDERLALLYNLNRKYGTSKGGSGGGGSAAPASEGEACPEDAILAYLVSAEAEIETLSGSEENREKLKNEIAAMEKTVAEKAGVIRKKRIASAAVLGEQITAILKHLGMPNASFSPSITAKTSPRQDGGDGPRAAVLYGPWGAEDVQFLISANSGEPLKDLSRVASGGELSRVMLAIKTVLSVANAPGGGSPSESAETLIFDEIDAGIGGEVALAVGEYLEKIGETRQIFCVTHLASIAVRASNHFKVEKRTEGGRTFTGVGPLSTQERRKEIARMLAGDSGKAALAHADEMISKYQKGKGIEKTRSVDKTV